MEVVRENGRTPQMYDRPATRESRVEILVEFLERHRDLALGRVRSKEARAVAARLWRECAEHLNVAGPARSSKEWPKVWNDLKCRIRAKLVNINANQQATGGGPSSSATLTPLEDRVANILGRDVGPLSNVRQNQFVVPNDDDSMAEANEVVVNYNEIQNVSQEIVIPLEEHQEEACPEAASPVPSLTGHVPSPPPISRRIVRAQQRNERAPHQLAGRASAQSNRTALDESREMVLRVETLRAEAALKNAEALSCFAEGFKLIAESIDRFSVMFCRQHGERNN